MLLLWFLVLTLLSNNSLSVITLHEKCDEQPNLCIESNDNKNNDKNELIFAHVIFRHGQRNADQYNYPNDPNKDEDKWSGGFSQITNEGKRQMYRLGQFLRQRYDDLLGNEYSYKKIYIQSTDTDRAIISGLATLAGLYPPQQNEIWNENITWQPISIHSVPFKYDIVLSFGIDCPKYRLLRNNYEKSPEVKQIYTEYADKFLQWSKMCGKKIETIFNVAELYTTISLAKYQNKSLAEWQEKEIVSNGPMEIISKFHFKMPTGTKQMARLFSGPLIKEIFERFQQKINSTLQPDRSVWIYSAHDLSMSNLLNSLNLFELHIPPFASSIHLELYKSNVNGHYIQIFYRKSNEEILTAMNIPNCGNKCSLERLYELYKDIIPIDLKSECMTL